MTKPVSLAIDVSEFQAFYTKADFDILKIRTQFDITSLHQKVGLILSKYGLMRKDDFNRYFGLGLQYDDESNPLYDAINSTDYTGSSKKIHYKRNEISYQLDEIYKKFQSVKLSRGRILLAMPQFRMHQHTDGPFVMTLHIPIQTNENCLIVVNNNAYHLPATGDAYLLNATRPHYAINNSKEDRIHITFPIGPASFPNWNLEDLKKFSAYYEMMGLRDPKLSSNSE